MDEFKITEEDSYAVKWLFDDQNRALTKNELTTVLRKLILKHNALIEHLKNQCNGKT